MRILAGATVALRRIVDLGLIALILVALFGVLLGKGAPLVGRQSIVIGGGSMEPTLGLGSAIVIRPIATADLAVGEIVSMQVGPERTTYTHRIIAVVDRTDGRWIRTKGDANAEPDPTLVPASAVLGRVEVVIPYAGYLLALLSLPMGVMFVLGLAATLLAIAWLLESLEPEPRPARRSGTAVEAAPWEPGLALPALQPDPALLRLTAEGELARGEPIAARPNPLTPSVGARGFRTATAGGPSIAARPGASVARPTVREQIERSREVRNRRARWQLGRGRDQGAAD